MACFRRFHTYALLALAMCMLSVPLASAYPHTQFQTTALASGSYRPPNGFVPDKATAIRIAEAVWIPIYGKKQIESERPFHAVLRHGVWIVSGSLPQGQLGGVAGAEISKSDGQILQVTHSK